MFFPGALTIKQDSYKKGNESVKEAQKETMRLIDIGLPRSKNKVNSNSKARRTFFPKQRNYR